MVVAGIDDPGSGSRNQNESAASLWVAHASRVLAIANFLEGLHAAGATRFEGKPVSAGRRNQHARRPFDSGQAVRYPEVGSASNFA